MQLSFLDLIVPKETAPKPPTWQELMKAGLKAQRFAEPDRVDWLREQVRRMNETNESMNREGDQRKPV